jgi:hypothetical protein
MHPLLDFEAPWEWQRHQQRRAGQARGKRARQDMQRPHDTAGDEAGDADADAHAPSVPESEPAVQSGMQSGQEEVTGHADGEKKGRGKGRGGGRGSLTTVALEPLAAVAVAGDEGGAAPSPKPKIRGRPRRVAK